MKLDKHMSSAVQRELTAIADSKAEERNEVSLRLKRVRKKKRKSYCMTMKWFQAFLKYIK
jgi:hypothetical protein